MIKLPNLEIGTTHTWNQIAEYACEEDRALIEVGFPSGDIEDRIRYKNKDPWVLEYQLLLIEDFSKQIDDFKIQFSKNLNHSNKVRLILDLLNSGGFAFPVFAHKRNPFVIVEGMHRSVAFRDLGSQVLPIFLVKYEGQ
jgi:hypothetical protein